MRIVYVAPYLPYVGIAHAGGFFFYHYVKTISGSEEVSIVSPRLPQNQIDMRGLPLRVAVHTFPVIQGKLGPFYRVRAAWHRLWFTTGPGLRTTLSLRAALHAVNAIRGADLIEIQWSQYLGLLPLIRHLNPNAPVVAFLHDVLFQSVVRRARRARLLADRVKASLKAVPIWRAEATLANQCDMVFVLSEKDQSVLRRMGVRSPVRVVHPYVAIPEEASGPSENPTALFVGAMRRPENHESIRWFVDQVWPAVRRRIPEAKLLVVGADPPTDLVTDGDIGVEVTGYVADLGPVYRGARVFVAPLLTGAGVKFKVLQAMAHGLPVVGTPIAFEGIVELGGVQQFGRVADKPTELANALIRYLGNKSEADRDGRQSRRWVAETYDWNRTMLGVLHTYRELVSARGVAGMQATGRVGRTAG